MEGFFPRADSYRFLKDCVATQQGDSEYSDKSNYSPHGEKKKKESKIFRVLSEASLLLAHADFCPLQLH